MIDELARPCRRCAHRRLVHSDDGGACSLDHCPCLRFVGPPRWARLFRRAA